MTQNQKPAKCANCETELKGPYCWQCGQKATDLHRPIWWIFGEFLDSVFNYDSRTFRTLYLLFADPGEFTRMYNAGQRAALLPPFRLFIIATLIFFIALEVTGVALMQFRPVAMDLDDLPQRAQEEVAKRRQGITFETDGKISTIHFEMFVPMPPGGHITGMTDEMKEDIDKNLKRADQEAEQQLKRETGFWAFMIQTGQRAMHGFYTALQDPLKLNKSLNDWLPRMMLVLVPVLALLLALMHWRPRVYFIEHLIFSLHLHTVLFAALTIVVVLVAVFAGNVLAWTVAPIFAVYVWMGIKRVYGRGPIKTTLKFLILTLVYGLIFFVATGFVLLAALAAI